MNYQIPLRQVSRVRAWGWIAGFNILLCWTVLESTPSSKHRNKEAHPELALK
jgi:hypothetical protein